jgi:hypothetical protein
MNFDESVLLIEEKFLRPRDLEELTILIRKWVHDPLNLRGVFLSLAHHFAKKEGAVLTFKTRPGISFSLKAFRNEGIGKDQLFGLVDIIDDDPLNRWLSVCFYNDAITDPMEKGDFIPEGLLGKDGYCFDILENDHAFIEYIILKIDESFSSFFS